VQCQNLPCTHEKSHFHSLPKLRVQRFLVQTKTSIEFVRPVKNTLLSLLQKNISKTLANVSVLVKQTYFKELNANNSKHELQQTCDEHNTVDGLYGHNHALHNMLNTHTQTQAVVSKQPYTQTI
jgi:hypothetical protein